MRKTWRLYKILIDHLGQLIIRCKFARLNGTRNCGPESHGRCDIWVNTGGISILPNRNIPKAINGLKRFLIGLAWRVTRSSAHRTTIAYSTPGLNAT